MTGSINSRWDALDVLRGLTIILMLMNLSPGSWEFNFPWLVHAKWEGWTLIDMVAPAFLFCIGVALPLSLQRRASKGATQASLLKHVIWRSLLLIAIGFFLNLYPNFDFATVRIPGVLQRIGLCYGIVGVFVLMTMRIKHVALAALFVLVSYWALLYFVPAPGFDDPRFRFDQVGSWPAVIDRAVIGVNHFFPYWPVDGKVVFDPEGILSTWPACFNMLLGVLTGLAYSSGKLPRPALTALVAGVVMMALALLLQGICPIIKNIWTSTFALFSGGFALALLGLLMPVTQVNGVHQTLYPARIFGENPLLAYIICFLIAPLIDANWIDASGIDQGAATTSLRNASQAWFSQFVAPSVASFAFALCSIAFILAILLYCHRKRWILKL